MTGYVRSPNFKHWALGSSRAAHGRPPRVTVAFQQCVDIRREAGENIALLEAERGRIAIGHRIAENFEQQQVGINARRRLRNAARPQELGGLRDLARTLRDAGPVDALVRHRKRTQAFAEHAPFAMMPQHGLRDAKTLRAGRRTFFRRDGRRNRLPFRTDPAAIDFEENLALVGEMDIEGAGRVAGFARDAVGIGAEIADAVEQPARRLDKLAARLFRGARRRLLPCCAQCAAATVAAGVSLSRRK